MGCGKLSKGRAKEMIQAKLDPSVYCELKGNHPQLKSTGNSEDWTIELDETGEKFDSCMFHLKDQGIFATEMCADFYRHKNCQLYKFTLGPRGKMTRLDAGRGQVSFACGSRKLIDVTSVRTEGQKAVVKYTREVTLDGSSKAVSDCTLTVPEAGVVEREATFLRDDDGNWSMQLSNHGWSAARARTRIEVAWRSLPALSPPS